MHNSIDHLSQRTLRYWYVDGLAEIAGGAIILLTGLLYLVISTIPNSPVRNLLLGFGQPMLIVAAVLGAGKVVQYFKERITYPRTGYVAYKRETSKRRVLTIIVTAVFVAALVAFIALTQHVLNENWLPVISGALIALFTLYLAYRFGLKRFYVISVITFLLGLVTAWLALPGDYSPAFFFSSFGLVWVLSGAWTLAHYLQNTSPPAGEQA